jgi:hemerythrin-like metal-binding protein
MSTLQWSESLELGLSFMDDTHHEFVDLLARVVNASDADLLANWAALIHHTDDHFGREDEWMEATRFSSTNCHTTQHQVILEVMREGGKRGLAGDLGLVRQMAHELGIWFPQHAQSMDAALALHLRNVGFDAATGIVHAPRSLPAQTIHGCGGSSCSSTDAPESVSAAELGEAVTA